jgi:hypothetical protein
MRQLLQQGHAALPQGTHGGVADATQDEAHRVKQGVDGENRRQSSRAEQPVIGGHQQHGLGHASDDQADQKWSAGKPHSGPIAADEPDGQHLEGSDEEPGMRGIAEGRGGHRGAEDAKGGQRPHDVRQAVGDERDRDIHPHQDHKAGGQRRYGGKPFPPDPPAGRAHLPEAAHPIRYPTLMTISH